MIGTLLLLSVAVADPRPQLVGLQLAGRHREALARVEQEIRDHPDTAHQLGLDYLRGHLLDLVGDSREAGPAFIAAMAATPPLASYGRYRLALEEERRGHPEVASGLVASVVGARSSPPSLLPEAVRLLGQTLAAGGDCRLLRGLRPESLAAPERRRLQLAEADCALRAGQRELARSLLVALVEEKRDDDPARLAAERLADLLAETERGRVPLLVGLVFQQHHDFERALLLLQRVARDGSGQTVREREARAATGRAQLGLGRCAPAAVVFGQLATRSRGPEERAHAFYQQGHAYELCGQWPSATASFRRAYQAEPLGPWASPALFSALRLEWRRGNEDAAVVLYELLATRTEWDDTAERAALFLAASDLVRGRRARARAWLDAAANRGPEDRVELAYWRGRLAELEKNATAAVTSYLQALHTDLYHPLSQAALRRLREEPLARFTAAAARRLSVSRRPADLYGAWALLGDADAVGQLARRKLGQLLLVDRATAPYLQLAEVPVESWPLWSARLDLPVEMLLALGIWHEGAPAVREHFPPGQPALAFTASLFLARAGETARALAFAEDLEQHTPDRVPFALQPVAYQRLLYPPAYRDLLGAQGRLRGADPLLLAALLREGSGFDPLALSAGSARGLAQITLATASRLAVQLHMERFTPDDLYLPNIAIALGAAHLGELTRTFRNAPWAAVAAYQADEPQAALWRGYCHSLEAEEYFTKLGTKEARNGLRRVLTAWAHYQALQ
jgi:peptidoglycan lytic transglycosylase